MDDPLTLFIYGLRRILEITYTVETEKHVKIYKNVIQPLEFLIFRAADLESKYNKTMMCILCPILPRQCK